MSSHRPGRHQRRASQSVFVLPDNLAALDVDAAADVVGGKAGHGQDGGVAGEQQAGRHHRRAMSVAVASTRDLELIKEDTGSYKIGA
jgi:hypothetical protein